MSDHVPNLHIEHQRLLRMALIRLSEVTELASQGVVNPRYSIRLALAVAYSMSNGDREPYDSFWKTMQDRHEYTSEYKGNYTRATYLTAQLRGILRSVGFEPTVKLEEGLRNAWNKHKV